MNNITKTLLGSVLVLGSLFTGVTEAKASTAIRTETKCNFEGVCYTTQTVVDVCNDTGKPSRWDYSLDMAGARQHADALHEWKSTQPAGCVSL